MRYLIASTLRINQHFVLRVGRNHPVDVSPNFESLSLNHYHYTPYFLQLVQ